MTTLDILIPTYKRPLSLMMTLSGVASQLLPGLHVVVADQSKHTIGDTQVVQALRAKLEVAGGSLEWHHRRQVNGIAEQRDFLLRQAQTDHVLYLDDDVLLEPWVAGKMVEVIQEQRCGFVGAFPPGLSYRDERRPHQQAIEYWEGAVEPEVVEPGSAKWQRFQLHRASNLYHVSQKLPAGRVQLYKVAWVGACVLYDRAKLAAVGGFSFWDRLPRYHEGEEVLVQNLLLRRWGGCAIIPSGAYHAEVPTTTRDAEGCAEGHALDLLPEMVARYAPETAGAAEEATR